MKELFQEASLSSWRWECQGYYQADEETMRRWYRGDQVPYDHAWASYVQRIRQAGNPFERVRMLTEPLSDYLVWMIANTDRNLNAGEDIRWITDVQAQELGMPEYDFALLDDNRVVVGDREVIDDESTLAEHRAFRDQAWAVALPHRELLTGLLRTGCVRLHEATA